MIKLDLKLPSDYQPSAGELDNFVYLCCKYTIAWNMRKADLGVCLAMAGEIKGVDGLNKLLDVTLDYIWDHLAGGCDPMEDRIIAIKAILEEWYKNSTPESRAVTE